ncbi:hypothetical protein OG204_03625 [Streptomyces sp. NBC_01387]|uniref:DUF6643 family protein n=1 Tax=unclassified Streptomyces TaxID=2593676 RepID=UPI002024D15F|nr:MULTISPECIES: DUF6643 family protein [unclassified Streptomyces]MCX4552624.1 hypothetical protein [Streptomyces sp. NBC_01500]WSC23967.1 hypothetical protein OIE60_32225 [Streptomyces sp. NBC_01766]WSV57850.1 hypothetical protein OG282_31495 [Streptomyces sp. NBC_01014]
MTSPRATYGGGYYSAPSFPDTPIYDSLVAERGTPQIAPIRVPSAYDTGNSYLPALPSALPALPPGPSQHAPSYGYPQPMAQPVPMQHAPAPYIPQQAAAPRGYPGPQQQPQRPVGGAGYEAMRPAAPRPAPYEDPYNRPYQGRGY